MRRCGSNRRRAPTRSSSRRACDVATRGAASGAAALLRHPLAADLAALLLGGAAPDARVLVGQEGELQAGLADLALAADGLGVLDLLDRRAGGPDREEQIGVGVP